MECASEPSDGCVAKGCAAKTAPYIWDTITRMKYAPHPLGFPPHAGVMCQAPVEEGESLGPSVRRSLEEEEGEEEHEERLGAGAAGRGRGDRQSKTSKNPNKHNKKHTEHKRQQTPSHETPKCEKTHRLPPPSPRQTQKHTQTDEHNNSNPCAPATQRVDGPVACPVSEEHEEEEPGKEEDVGKSDAPEEEEEEDKEEDQQTGTAKQHRKHKNKT